ncbi:alanine--glyoxylate aminotransferase 2, mitochondrial isoform X2 [Rhipicephalus microplus]|uniref:alanine--glyoxylate aminotransferase 2, mitochondrial isoform X2 n=1 Tax=Rhipicephalus microplus TaxID=6941 RepID=UPI003F6CF44C
MHIIALWHALYCANKVMRLVTTFTPAMPPCDEKPKPYQGKPWAEVVALRKSHLNPSLSSNLLYKEPLLLTQGHMQWLWDHKGKRYLDMFAGIVTVSVGHCHPKVVAAAEKQLKQLWHTSNVYLYPTVHEFAEKLAEKMPGDLKVCYFTNSGSEANDLAMMMARLYTGAHDIIALRNAYHGMSPYCASLCAVGNYKHHIPSNFGVFHAMNPDPYRGVWGGSKCRDSPVQADRTCSCGTECQAASHYADQLNEVLQQCVSKKKVAAFFAESIQGVGGSVQYPRGYLKKAYDLIKNKGGLFVADEVQTGFGRTGENFWGFEGHSIMPDIVTMAKGIGNGFPLAAVVTTPEIAKALDAASFFNTFGGNPVATAVGSAVIDLPVIPIELVFDLQVLDEDGCMENSHVTGTRLLHALESLRKEYPVVGDVRGKGLMIGMELVERKETKVPLAAMKVNAILEDCREMGLLIGKGGQHGHVLRIKPPMCITEADVDFTVAVLRTAIARIEQQ